MSVQDDIPVLLFDGVCNFCSGSVLFVLKRTGDDQLKFCAMQTEAGQRRLQSLGEDTDDYASMILLKEGRAYYKSDAAIEIGRMMAWPWRLLSAAASIVPAGIRNWFYDRLAINRYRLFGKRAQCLAASAGAENRFITA